jgi:hypothetical protein
MPVKNKTIKNKTVKNKTVKNKTVKNKTVKNKTAIKTCENTICKKHREIAKSNWENIIKNLENIKDKTESQNALLNTYKNKNFMKNIDMNESKNCKLAYCNVGCKNTPFEKSDIFKLKNGFYEKLDANKLIKEGAISGCSFLDKPFIYKPKK